MTLRKIDENMIDDKFTKKVSDLKNKSDELTITLTDTTDKLINVVSVNKLDGVDDTTIIQAAVNSLDPSRINILTFQDTEYSVKQKITGLPKENLIIDLNNANFVWDGTGANTHYQGIFELKGEKTNIFTTVSQDEPERTNTITVVSASIFQIGDYIHIEPTPGAVDKKDVFNSYFARIDAIIGNTLYLDYEKRLGATAALGVTVTKINPVKNVIIRNIKTEANNQTARTNGMGGLFLKYCTNVKIENYSAKKFWFKGILAQFCTDILIDGVSISEPAATGGGEGYGVQFEYSHKCHVKNGRFHGLRHGTDTTASSWITFEDCIDSNGKITSYINHGAYEYQINYNNCISINNEQGGFACGSVGTGYADFVDSVKLKGCIIKGAKVFGLKMASKGSDFKVDNCELELSPSSTGHAFIVSRNNTDVSNTTFKGAVLITSSADTNNSGVVRINSAKLNELSSSRALILADSAVIHLDNSTVTGRVNVSDNTIINATKTEFKTIADLDLFEYSATTANIEILLKNCTITTNGSGTKQYTLLGKRIMFKSVKFQNELVRPIVFKSPTTIIEECEGLLRATVDGISSGLLVFKENKFRESQSATLLTISNYVGDIELVENHIKMQSVSRTAVDMSNVNNNIRAIAKDNIILGITNLSKITKGVVKNNIIDGVSTLPTNNGTTLIVGENIIT